jgi:hypothetical protein
MRDIKKNKSKKNITYSLFIEKKVSKLYIRNFIQKKTEIRKKSTKTNSTTATRGSHIYGK